MHALRINELRQKQRNTLLFLQTPLGGASVALLENRAAIRLFSNLFLFEEEADAAWLDEACADCSAAVRAPVLAFNAGLLSARDYSAELCNTPTPTLVSGTSLVFTPTPVSGVCVPSTIHSVSMSIRVQPPKLHPPGSQEASLLVT